MPGAESECAVALRAAISHREEPVTDAALALLYDEHAAPLYRYALALTGSPDDAEDAVQEVFLGLARQPGQAEHVGCMRAYLLTATRNAAYTLLRRRRRQRGLLDALLTGLAREPDDDVAERAVEGMLARESYLALPVEQREVLALKVFEGLSFREIAEVTGAPANTVASRYRYGIDRLRRALEDGDE